MVCDNCGSGEAVIHWTQVVNNQMKTLHLCEKCAADKGLETGGGEANHPLADFLAQIGEETRGGQVEEGARACSFCGLTLHDFRETGRLGCPHCWEVFEGPLRNLLRRVHGATQHVGKIYLPPDPALMDRQERLATLRRSLQRAIETEDFERAAQLRDQIRALEGAT